jgi:hypothetical protein
MDERVTELERRVAVLERELGELRQLPTRRESSGVAAPAVGIAARVPMLQEALSRQNVLAEGFAAMLRQLGIEGQPIGAENLQAMMIAEGIDPNSNEFSRGIIEMREE